MKEVDRADERPDVVMTVADKDAINSFSRLLARRSELLATAKRREKLLQLYEDASDELMLMDDDTPAQYMVGDVFIFDDKERIEANVEETKESFRKEIADSNADLDSVTADIASIKATLYAKFGKTINLEE